MPMLRIITILAIQAGLALAVNLDVKTAHDALCPDSPSPSVCPHNEGPYWYICGQHGYLDASDLCAAYGWRQALMTTDNAPILNQLMSNCTGVFSIGWVAGIHGLAADPCAYVYAINIEGVEFGGYLGLGNQRCGNAEYGVLCEEIPQTTISTTSTAREGGISTDTTTTTTAIRTRTVSPFEPHCTDCPKPSSCSSSSSSHDSSFSGCCDSSFDSSSSSSWCPHDRRHKSGIVKQETPVCYTGDCLPVCNYSVGGIHLITANVNYTDTAAECAKYGWKVLDYTDGRSQDLFTVVRECVSVINALWYINSYNGVESACSWLSITELNGQVVASAGFPGNDALCRNIERQVFCQEQCQFPVVDSGVETGLVSISTVQSVTFEPYTVATSTSIVATTCTETVFTKL